MFFAMRTRSGVLLPALDVVDLGGGRQWRFQGLNLLVAMPSAWVKLTKNG